jgi:hypothetical protein
MPDQWTRCPKKQTIKIKNNITAAGAVPYSINTANPAATTPKLNPTRPAPLGLSDPEGLGGELVTVGFVLFPPIPGMLEPEPLGAATPAAVATLAAVAVTVFIVDMAEGEPLEEHLIEPICTGLVAIRAGDVELKSSDPFSLPDASLKA